jgi:hypothetical protein
MQRSFKSELAQLAEIQAAMAKAVTTGSGNWRRELVDLRRKLQTQITAVALAIDDCEIFKDNNEIKRNLRDSLSAMRSALALHQGDWPAVSIDPSDPAYVNSTAAVRAAIGPSLSSRAMPWTVPTRRCVNRKCSS